MFTDEPSDDYSPITVVGNVAIYATELLVAVHIISMVVFSVLAASTGRLLGQTFLDLSIAYVPDWIVGHFQIWRLATYAFQDHPSWGFAIDMVMLWWFGRDVEKFYGRRNFLISYGILMLVPAMVGLLPIFLFPLSGPQDIHYGLFLMFAATYPGVMLLFNIQVKWWAWGGLAIASLIHLAGRDWNGLTLIWLVAFLAYGITRQLGRGEWLPERLQDLLPTFRKPKFTVVRSEPGGPAEVTDDDPVSSINPILDKIAKQGISSLSKKEWTALQAASGELQKKDHH